MLIQRGKERVEQIERVALKHTLPYVKQIKLETTEQLNNRQKSRAS